MSEMCCTRLAANTGRKKIAICAPSHKFVGIYIHNKGTHRQTENNFLNSNVSPTCPYNMVNFGSLTADICWRVWGTTTYFNGFRVFAALLHGTSSRRQPKFAALNRGRHLYAAGRPSRWALAYILVLCCSFFFLFSKPNPRGRRLDIYHTSTRIHDMVLVRI